MLFGELAFLLRHTSEEVIFTFFTPFSVLECSRISRVDAFLCGYWSDPKGFSYGMRGFSLSLAQ